MDHNKLWTILKEIGIPDHLICLLRNLYAGQEATVRTGYGTTDWFQINNPVYETAKETVMYRTVLWTLWERERVGRFGRMALKHVKYHV